MHRGMKRKPKAERDRWPSRNPKAAVLFLHGLESGTNGRKAQYLKKRFPTEVPDMQMSAINPRKRNSPAKWLIPFGLASVLSCGMVACTSSLLRSAQLLGLCMVMFVILGRWRMQVALAACVDIAVKAIARGKPTVIVASSWGGAVALRCVELGLWQGPTVLLAPAVETTGVFSLFWPSWQPQLPAAAAAKCRIIQGEQDSIVPVKAVTAMAKQNGMCIELFPDGDHRLNEQCLKKSDGLEAFVMATLSQSEKKV